MFTIINAPKIYALPYSIFEREPLGKTVDLQTPPTNILLKGLGGRLDSLRMFNYILAIEPTFPLHLLVPYLNFVEFSNDKITDRYIISFDALSAYHFLTENRPLMEIEPRRLHNFLFDSMSHAFPCLFENWQRHTMNGQFQLVRIR